MQPKLKRTSPGTVQWRRTVRPQRTPVELKYAAWKVKRRGSSGLSPGRAHQLVPKLRTLTSIGDPLHDHLVDLPHALDALRYRELRRGDKVQHDVWPQRLPLLPEIAPQVGEVAEFLKQFSFNGRQGLHQAVPLIAVLNGPKVAARLEPFEQVAYLSSELASLVVA